MPTPMTHRNGAFREGGVVEAAFLLKDLDVEIIADGAHLPRELLQLIYAVKGREHIAPVTDCIRCGGEDLPDGARLLYDVERDISVVIRRGAAVLPGEKSFAGSLSTTSRLVRTMVHTAGIPLHDAVYMAARAPARMIGLDGEIGSIEAGKRGDLLVPDQELRVRRVLLNGETAFTRDGGMTR